MTSLLLQHNIDVIMRSWL